MKTTVSLYKKHFKKWQFAQTSFAFLNLPQPKRYCICGKRSKKKIMELHKNMGIADRIIRPVVAGGIIAASATGKIKGPLETGLLLLSGILLITSATGSCPAYEVAGIDSMSEE
jgi:hypothetical protein